MRLFFIHPNGLLRAIRTFPHSLGRLAASPWPNPSSTSTTVTDTVVCIMHTCRPDSLSNHTRCVPIPKLRLTMSSSLSAPISHWARALKTEARHQTHREHETSRPINSFHVRFIEKMRRQESIATFERRQ